MDSVAKPTKTLTMIRSKGLSPRKSRGQNFLVDANIVRKIASISDLGKDDIVVEIGPGLGALTQELADRAGFVIGVEIDRGLLSMLQDTFKGRENVRFYEGDALKTDFDHLVHAFTRSAGGRLPKYKIVANLPYYITTPVLFHLLENKFQITEMVLMVQAEVARRMLSLPGKKDYGALSVAVQYYTQPSIALKVPPTVFYPRPKVESMVVKLVVREQREVAVADEKFFFMVVRKIFNQRRKMLINVLEELGLERQELKNTLERAGINPNCRGENLSIKQFAELSSIFASAMKRR